MRRSGGIGAETKAEAAAWLARLHADDRSEADERAFQAWVRANPENARAFEAVTAVWDLADGLRVAQPQPAFARPLLRRRSILVGLGSLIAAGGSFTVWQQAFAGVYETGIGEQKRVNLSDGTQVFLDTDTRIRERFSETLRVIELQRGRANFHVKPDAKRPFMVEAANQRVLADRSTFDVRRDGDRLSVVLLQGRATVLAQALPATRGVALHRGQRLIVAVDVAARIDTPNLAPLIAWQNGQAIFDGETLAAAAAEMNRYSTVRLGVDDPLVGKLRLSGVYRVGDNEAFARSVSQLLPVLVEHYPDHIALVRDESRMPEG